MNMLSKPYRSTVGFLFKQHILAKTMSSASYTTKPAIHQVFLAVLTCISLAFEFFYPHYTVMAANIINPAALPKTDFVISMDLGTDFNGAAFPVNEDRKPRGAILVMATAYSSTPDQTDGDPFTTAWGTQVRDGIIASNFLPLGAHVKIPNLYGDKFFRVEDRMNPRYDLVIDIWMESRQDAKQFGKRTTKIEIY